jgi:hypothetical protein
VEDAKTFGSNLLSGETTTFDCALLLLFLGLVATFEAFETAFAVFEFVTIEVVSKPATPAMTFLRETIRAS